MAARVEHFVTAGTFSLDGGTWDVENNVWIVGDDTECALIDAPHDVQAIIDHVGQRAVRAVLLTHAHDDHVRVAPQVAAALGAPLALHPDDLPVWELTHPDVSPANELVDGMVISVAGVDLTVVHTPGHTPGSSCYYAAALGVVFTGDTLFRGGPGATGRSFSDFDTIIESIRTRLLTLPPETAVLPGHGDSTTIGDEAAHLHEWIARGR